jgi:hypothetical protein
MTQHESKPVRSWRSMGMLAVAILLLHAFLSGWLVNCEQIAAVVPELADECIEGMTGYQRETALLGESFHQLGRSFGFRVAGE